MIRKILILVIIGIFCSNVIGTCIGHEQSQDSSFNETWYVSVKGSDETGDGTKNNPWRNIGFAIANDLVIDGDTIKVMNGTYNENFDIDKQIELVAENSNIKPIINTSHKWGLSGIEIWKNDVVISGFIINSTRDEPAIDVIRGDHTKIKDNIFQKYSEFEEGIAIDITYEYNLEITNNEFINGYIGVNLQGDSTALISEDNYFSPLLTYDIYHAAYINGTDMYYGSINEVIEKAESGEIIYVKSGYYYENVEINKPRISLISENGASSTIINGMLNIPLRIVEWSSNSLIDGFNIVDGLLAGIFIAFSEQVTVKNCVVQNCKYGIHYYHCEHGSIQFCTFNNNWQGILLEFSGDIEIIYNEIKNNNNGLTLDVSQAGINHNNINDNNFGLIIWRCGSRNTYITNNNFENNSKNNIAIADTMPIWLHFLYNYYFPEELPLLDLTPWHVEVIIMRPIYDWDWFWYPLLVADMSKSDEPIKW